MDLQFCPGAVVMVFVATLVAAFITSGGVVSSVIASSEQILRFEQRLRKAS
jgi:hypothetical protein